MHITQRLSPSKLGPWPRDPRRKQSDVNAADQGVQKASVTKLNLTE